MNLALFFSLASSVLPWFAYYIADWKYTCILASIPLLVGVVILYIVPESAKWLVSVNRVDDAVIILKRIAKINNKQVDPKLYDKLKGSCHPEIFKEKEKGHVRSVYDLFQARRLRKIIFLLIVTWMAISLLYNGLDHQASKLGLDLFVMFSITSMTKLPADLLLTFTLDKWGRRWYAFGSMVLSGIFSILIGSFGSKKLRHGFSIVSRFMINISYDVGLQYSAEILPTVVRAQGVLFIHVMGYVVAMFLPFIYKYVINDMLIFIVLGIIGIIGGILTLFLPEYKNHTKKKTLKDGEKFCEYQMIYQTPCYGNNCTRDYNV
ncbi:hypothetical protein WDU94_007028 [Cyamophila willieti]